MMVRERGWSYSMMLVPYRCSSVGGSAPELMPGCTAFCDGQVQESAKQT